MSESGWSLRIRQLSVDRLRRSVDRLLRRRSKDPTDYRFPLAIYKPVSAKNIDVVVRFKPVDGKVDQARGIVVRLTTPDDYYVVRANALEDNVCFYRVVKSKREQITGADTKVASNDWHTLGLRAEGESVQNLLRWGATLRRPGQYLRRTGKGGALVQGRQCDAF